MHPIASDRPNADLGDESPYDADMKTSSGQALNDLVAVLERTLVGGESASVDRNVRVPDRDTGRLREHDVLIRWKQRHHAIVTAIECRDRRRPVGVPDVEAFAHKCSRTGVDHMMIVSSTGFAETARVKAAALGVTLMELREASAFDWCQMDFWVEDRREFVGFNATVFFSNNVAPSSPFQLFDTARREVSGDILQSTLTNAYITEGPPGGEPDVFTPISVHMNTVDWVGRDTYGAEFPITHILAHGGFTIRRTLRPVTLHKYQGSNGSYDVASADALIGDTPGKLLMVADGERIQVVWSGPEAHPDA